MMMASSHCAPADQASGMIWLVDDYEDSRDIAATFLNMHGFDVRTFESAETVLEALRTDRPDVLVTDISLPGLSGSELARTVRDTEGTRGLPVIALTGMPKDRVAEGAMFNQVLIKPFSPDRLDETLRESLRSSHG